MSKLHRMLISVLVVSLGAAPVGAEPLDSRAIAEHVELLTDGKGHYVAAERIEGGLPTLYSSADGKRFVRNRSVSASTNGNAWSVGLWDPRVHSVETGLAEVVRTGDDERYAQCAHRKTPLTVVPEAEAQALLANATFVTESWTRLPEKLLRDEEGTYYFVDRLRTRDSSDRRDFRVFVGKRGSMKQLPLKNVVDDHQGMIFATKSGDLRLVTLDDGKLEGKWVQKKREVRLLELDLSRFDSARLVYLDLGPYSGMRLGSVCDDMM